MLRLSKVKVGGDGGDEEEEGSVALLHSQRRRVEREVAFANSVFIPLLGVEYVGHVQAVHLTPKTIQKLNTALLKLRPGEEEMQHVLNTCSQNGCFPAYMRSDFEQSGHDLLMRTFHRDADIFICFLQMDLHTCICILVCTYLHPKWKNAQKIWTV